MNDLSEGRVNSFEEIARSENKKQVRTIFRRYLAVPVVNFIRLAYCRESRNELPHAGCAQAYLVGAHWAVPISSVA